MSASHQFPTRSVHLAQHPARLPSANISDDADHASISTSAIQRLSTLSIDDLTDDAIWRDTCALTGTLRTFYSSSRVRKVWEKLSAKHKPTNFARILGSSHVTRLGPHGCWVEAMFTFDIQEPRPARCSGIIGLVPSSSGFQSNEWKIWMLSTILEQPEGFRNVDELEPQPSDTKAASVHAGHREKYDCVVVGGGIAGLCMAARLQALGLSYLLIEKQATIGENWRRNRYDSLKLHTSKSYNQMPYEPRTFREQDPYHLGTADLADGFERFVDTFGINLMLSTELTSGSWDSDTKCWSLKMMSNGSNFKTTASHCVLAVGNQGVKPNMPSYPGRDLFQGEIIHGMDWRNADRWKGKGLKGICVGSANTAHGVSINERSSCTEQEP